LNVALRSPMTEITSQNVVGMVPGTSRERAGEHIVISSHWDAYGIGPAIDGDSIYNGALDDGSGVIATLALARYFAAHPQPRTLVFLFATAEEWGLLGSEAFARAGPIPARAIVANLNLDDGPELFGPRRDVAPLGIELSTLGRTVREVAARRGLTVTPDPLPQEGFFLRADNYSFAAAGVPSLYLALGTDAVGRPAGWVDSKVKEYLEHHYHRPSDEYAKVVVDLEGSRQLVRFARDLTIAVATSAERPSWLPGAEYHR
jgi:Zn-dependent M28 family amino/carboxypeptidase